MRARLAALAARRGGWLVALAVLYGYLLLLLAKGGHLHWLAFWVPAIAPAFYDMRSVTSAWECVRKGVEVIAMNPCDPGHRPANYPRLWLWLSAFGLGQGDTLALGLATAGVFFASALALVRRVTLVEGLVFGTALIAPAVMLGVERGNTDLLVFPLVVLGVALFRRAQRELRAAGHAVLLLAGALKLFPVFAWVVLLRQPRRWVLVGGGAVLTLFLAYAIATFDDIRTILEVVPQAIYYSFGAGVGLDALGGWLREHGEGGVAADVHGTAPMVVALLLALGLAALLAWRRRAAVPAEEPGAEAHPLTLDTFVAGAAMYVGSFAAMHNWDYRLVVLLLTIPQLARWAQTRVSPVPLPRLTLLATLGTLWLSEPLSIRNPGAPFEEILNWFVFVSFASGLLVVLAPAVRALVSSQREAGALRLDTAGSASASATNT